MLRLLSIVMIAISATLPVVTASPPALAYDVAAVKGADLYHMTVTITNKGNSTAKLLNNPDGTLSTLPTNAFKITHDETGEEPEFYGVVAKYVPEIAVKIGKEDAFTMLKAGGSVTVTHNLLEAYNFTSTGTGGYTVVPTSKFLYVDESGVPLEVLAPTQKTAITLDTAPVAWRSVDATLNARASFRGCTTAQSNKIVEAGKFAQVYAQNAYSNLAIRSSRSVTWFGAYDRTRQSTAQNHFAKIAAMGYSGITYDCSCTDSDTFAYVYPNIPAKMYFCGAYWSAPLTGTDSKAGTMVHESSHYSINGGTKDYVYGQSGAKHLAQSNPAKAIMSADNHEYFVEGAV